MSGIIFGHYKIIRGGVICRGKSTRVSKRK